MAQVSSSGATAATTGSTGTGPAERRTRDIVGSRGELGWLLEKRRTVFGTRLFSSTAASALLQFTRCPR
eukprot:3662879-Prymnesium_polylepis.1